VYLLCVFRQKRDQKYFLHNFNNYSLVAILFGNSDLQSALDVTLTAMHAATCSRNVHQYY